MTPLGVDYLGKAHHHRHRRHANEEEDFETALLEEFPEQPGSTEIGLKRLDLWGITWQLLNLVGPIFYHYHHNLEY